MKEQLRSLYELQAIDVKIARANAQIAALTGSKELRAKYSATKAALQKVEKTLAEYELEVRDNELQLKSIDEKRGNFEKRLYSGAISNPKELSATEKEIEALKAKQGELDVRTLELYEQVEATRTKVESARSILQTVETQARKAIKYESDEKTRLEAEISELTVQREAAVANVTEKALFSKYESIRKHNSSTGIAKVIDGRCEGCHVAITSFTMSNLFKDNEIETCENCGRILFMDIA
ncbi:MAG: C4-type zinc ribbon domain-containing protein [Armatimonadota bacterium]|nr:C4-type zinc ribbon domain-containing protein [bacterium]